MTEAVQMGDAAVARSLAADAGAGNKTVTLYRGVALKAFGLYKYGNVDNIFGQYFWEFLGSMNPTHVAYALHADWCLHHPMV